MINADTMARLLAIHPDLANHKRIQYPSKEEAYWKVLKLIREKGWQWGFFYDEISHEPDRVFVQHDHTTLFSGGIARYNGSEISLIEALLSAYVQACENMPTLTKEEYCKKLVDHLAFLWAQKTAKWFAHRHGGESVLVPIQVLTHPKSPFYKLVTENHGVIGFIAAQDGSSKTLGAFECGDVFYPRTYYSPAKGKRGSIFDPQRKWWGWAGPLGVKSLHFDEAQHGWNSTITYRQGV